MRCGLGTLSERSKMILTLSEIQSRAEQLRGPQNYNLCIINDTDLTMEAIRTWLIENDVAAGSVYNGSSAKELRRRAEADGWT